MIVNLSWIHIAFLFAGIDHALFHSLAGRIYLLSQLSSSLTGANILLLGLVLFVSWRYARRAGLLREEITHQNGNVRWNAESSLPRGSMLSERCLCLVNTYVSIAFIVLVQLNFALAPRLPFVVGDLVTIAAQIPRCARREER